MTFLQLRDIPDEEDDSDPCGSDTCPSTTHSPRPQSSQTLQLPSSSLSPSQSQTLSGGQPPQTPGATHNGGQGDNHDNGSGNGSSTPPHKSSFNKSAIGGIVIGILLVLGLLVLLLLWLRRRVQQRRELRTLNAGSTGETRLLSDTPVAAQSSFSQTTTPPSLIMPNLPGGLGSQPRHEQMRQVEYANMGHSHLRSLSATTLPNPYDGIYVDHDSDHDDRPLPPTPAPLVSDFQTPSSDNDTPDMDHNGATAVTSPSRTSQAPSAWRTSAVSNAIYSDITDSRASSMMGGSSMNAPSEEVALLGEMASYQKRLESHHRKESEDAIAEAVAIPSDPPPSYSLAEDRDTHQGGSGAEHTIRHG